MMADKIHDALNYIDDDMIEAVERLREVNAQKRRRFKLCGVNMKVVAAAAVICLIATVAFTIGPEMILMNKQTSADGCTNGAGPGSMSGAGVTGGSVYEEEGDTDGSEKINVILVRVTKVQTNGFAAKIVNDYGQGDIYNSGDTRAEGAETGVLNIIYSEDTEFVEGVEPEVGSVVKIEYSKESGKIVAYRVMYEDYEE